MSAATLLPHFGVACWAPCSGSCLTLRVQCRPCAGCASMKNRVATRKAASGAKCSNVCGAWSVSKTTRLPTVKTGCRVFCQRYRHLPTALYCWMPKVASSGATRLRHGILALIACEICSKSSAIWCVIQVLPPILPVAVLSMACSCPGATAPPVCRFACRYRFTPTVAGNCCCCHVISRPLNKLRRCAAIL
ncbi:hypothetical protein GALL_423020 [mine drainage metagenome]|uniref:Uncharacterized protein n=1 Tax=mine drainage metagenome TaxID=410659 RepID=A0A1J5QET1_9ZZZZ